MRLLPNSIVLRHTALLCIALLAGCRASKQHSPVFRHVLSSSPVVAAPGIPAPTSELPSTLSSEPPSDNPPAPSIVLPPLTGRVSLLKLVTSQRAIEQGNRARVEDWIRAGRAEAACQYLAASTAGTWLIEQALRSRVERAAELFGASEDFMPQRKVREYCAQAIPERAVQGPEYPATPALVRELRELEQFSKWERTMLERFVQVDQDIADAGGRRHPLEYLRAIRGAFVDYCASSSRFVGDVAQLRRHFDEADTLYRMTAVGSGADAEPGPYARVLSKVVFRGSELAVTASETVESLCSLDRLPDTSTHPGVVLGGILIGAGGGSVVGLLAALAMGPSGAIIGILAGTGGLIGTGAGVDYDGVTVPERRVVTDGIFKAKGVLDLLAHASFDSVRSVTNAKPHRRGEISQAIEVSPSGAYADETRPGSDQFRALYTVFSNVLVNEPRQDGFGRFSRETYRRTVEVVIPELRNLRHQACDLYPLEWDGQKFCRLLHRRRCEDVGRDTMRSRRPYR